MEGLDQRLAAIGDGHVLFVALAVALVLGLRHATDPDHLTAMSTLIAGDARGGLRRARSLGLAWGAGHATTLLLCGLPIVAVGARLPATVQRAAEAAIGVVIMALALRVLVRWRAGQFHVHAHQHGEVEHRHLHSHDARRDHDHLHAHERAVGRSPMQSYGIGLLHGAGGSAGVGVLLLANIGDRAVASAALVVFAVATAASMSLLSCGFGYLLTRGPVLRRGLVLSPALGAFSLAFGCWYALGAF